jgi:hypothetical protein
MKAAIYVACPPGDGHQAEVEAAQAFCLQHGLAPVRWYPADMLQNKAKVETMVRDAKDGLFQVIVAPFPECFGTPLLKRLVAAGVGLAIYPSPARSSGRRP